MNSIESIQKEWNEKGEKYAREINEMVEFGEKNGWENWKGDDPQDLREHLSESILQLLKEANLNNTVSTFREQFAPSDTAYFSILKEKGQSIEQLHFIDNQKIIFITGSAFQKRQAYILDNDKVVTLDENILAVGKSNLHNIFAIATKEKITTISGWEGEKINEFKLDKLKNIDISYLIPFNNGNKVLVVTSEGIYLINTNSEVMIHPVPDENDDEWESYLAMENATLSHDNKYIVVGDQDFNHRILDSEGNQIGTIGPQSEYPHFCLFAKDDSQLITNSCHFYNGITIGINSDKFVGAEIEAYSESDDFTNIDEEMRVYAGLATKDYYILGDAYGYIKAIDRNGNKIWRHYLGSSISGMTISDDETILWVGSYSGALHKIILDKPVRDKHTIGNGNLYETFRLFFWKDEPQIWKW